jgi:hypothetical protein
MTVPAALDRLFKQSSPSAHEIVLGYRHYLGSAHLSAASIKPHRHLAQRDEARADARPDDVVSRSAGRET